MKLQELYNNLDEGLKSHLEKMVLIEEIMKKYPNADFMTVRTQVLKGIIDSDNLRLVK